MATVGRAPRASRVVEELKKCGVTHVICLPDSGARFIYDILYDQKEITVIPVCREGEAFAIAAGLTTGGKEPVVLIQNTGFFESGDSIRGITLGLKFPLLIMIGCRGWQKQIPWTDSAAIFIEPILDAWGIKHYLVETVEDADKVSMAYKEAHETSSPVTILLTPEVWR